MLKTEAKYITKTAGNDCVIMRCEKKKKKKTNVTEKKTGKQGRGENNCTAISTGFISIRTNWLAQSIQQISYQASEAWV